MTKQTDFCLQAAPGRPFTILQLTDMQLIDAAQQRYSDRLRGEEPALWKTENMDSLAFAHIRKTVDTVKQDLIILTGDLIYGEFDDSGASHQKFCDCMGSFGIPWAPVFGNHDNETAMGVDWQCDLYAHAKNCLFANGFAVEHVYQGETVV